jgi:hypothetical protein
MADLKYLDELLSSAAGILDTAATEIRDVSLSPTQENILRIGQALALVFDIQQQIYKVDPKLEPEYLKRPSPYPPELNRRFGKILIAAADLYDEKKYNEAISLYESFIAENPPNFFIKMAKGRIRKIKKDHGV